MAATMEGLHGKGQGIRSSTLKKPVAIRMHGSRALLEPDGSLRSFDLLQEERSAFGSERLLIYKVQAGVVVQAPRTDWLVKAAPHSALVSGRVFDAIEVTQSVEFFRGNSPGYLRKVRLRNSGTSQITLRLIDIQDPTAAQLGGSSARWGSLGVNAFNRGSHVAMDEISDPPSARVVGAIPPPKKFYMTTDKGRAQDAVTTGELPDPTAGMSGQVLIFSLHEMELSPSESKEVTFASIYNPLRLEDALSDFGRVGEASRPEKKFGPAIACSSPTLTEAVAWAVALLEGAQFIQDALDRYESLQALSYVEPTGARAVFERARSQLRNEGWVPHAQDQAEPGMLETSMLLQRLAGHLLLARDKKLARQFYPVVRRLASWIIAASKEFSVQTDPVLPQGWRRLLGRGYPTGEIPEVSLAAASGLAGAARVARMIAKPDEAGKFRERSEMIAERVRKRLLDDRGFLCLCLESTGRQRDDETIDMAVAGYRHPFLQSAEQSAVHRLLEKDFETPYGPRTVPRSNKLYFNPTYGRGQLGGFWTRAALTHALLCYRVGLAGIGSLALDKVGKLVVEDSPKLGGSPGEFPYWVDVEGRELHGDDSDPVAASRLIEGLVQGDLGFDPEAGDGVFTPPSASSLKWVFASDIWVGEPASIFVGRGGGATHVFAAGARVEVKQGTKYAVAEQLDVGVPGFWGASMHGPGQAICLGNSSNSPLRSTITFAPRANDLSKRLSTPLEEYDRTRGGWTKVTTLRVVPTMTFEASLGAGDWKVFRISTG